jgi:alkane 1-monooxygenase
MARLRYLLPFAFLALLPIGALLGGAWTFLAVFAIPLALTILDLAIGAEREGRPFDGGSGSRWLARSYIVLQLTVTLWVATMVASGARPLEMVGLSASTGVTAGIFGFLAAHEMVHSRNVRDRALGMIFLASVLYMHFRIAHIFGHHRRAATADDPATARLGESLYVFLGRSIWGQLSEAWQIEAQRLRKTGRSPITGNNRIIAYVSIEILVVVATGLLSTFALIYFVGIAIIAICLLETFNYVAHYGLVRLQAPNGRFEPMGPQHSWNSRLWMNNAALFNMGRHSDHHRHTARPFAQLRQVEKEAELPSGYAAAVLTAFVPPLWRSQMDHRVALHRASDDQHVVPQVDRNHHPREHAVAGLPRQPRP